MASPVTIKILGDSSNFNKAMRGVSGTLGNVGKAAGVAIASVGAVGVGIAASVTKSAVSFEEDMANVFTLLPGISRDAMDEMGDDVLALSKKMGVLPDDVVPGLYDALSAGVPQDNVFEFIEGASKLAIGGSIEVGEAVDILTTSVNAWSESSLTATEASDYLFTTVKLGKTTMGELNSSLSSVAPTAAAVGVGLDEVGASLAVLTAGGMPTAQAATAMNAALAELAKTGTKASDAFAEMNDGQTFDEFIKAGGSLEEAMVMIAESGEPVLDMFGSVDAAKGVLALTADDASLLTANMLEMSDAAGATDAAFGTMNETTARAMETVKANLAAVSIEIGNKLLPVLASATDYVVESWPKWSAAIMPVVDVIVDGLKAFKDTLVTGEVDGSGGLSGFLQRFALFLREDVWPVLVDIKDWVVDNWPTISDVISTVFDFLTDTVFPALVTAGGFVYDVIKSIVDYVVDHWPEISAVMETVKDFIVNDVVPFLVEAYELVRDTVSDVIDAIEQFWTDHKEDIKIIFDEIKAVVDDLWEGIKLSFGIFKAAFEGDWETFWADLETLLDKASDKIINAASRMYFGLKPWVSKAFEWYKTKAKENFDLVVEELNKLPDRMVAALVAHGPDLLKGAYDFGMKIYTGIYDAVIQIPGMIADIIKSIPEKSLGLLGRLFPGASAIVGAGQVGGFVSDAASNLGHLPAVSNLPLLQRDIPVHKDPYSTEFGGGSFDYTYGGRIGEFGMVSQGISAGSMNGGQGHPTVTVNVQTNASAQEIGQEVVDSISLGSGGG